MANFYPSIASGLGRWLYNATQSRIHVIVTHGFLRSLARLDLPVRVDASVPPAGVSRLSAVRSPTRRSLARSCVALMRLIVPERERVTSDSVVAPPALG